MKKVKKTIEYTYEIEEVFSHDILDKIINNVKEDRNLMNEVKAKNLAIAKGYRERLLDLFSASKYVDRLGLSMKYSNIHFVQIENLRLSVMANITDTNNNDVFSMHIISNIGGTVQNSEDYVYEVSGKGTFLVKRNGDNYYGSNLDTILEDLEAKRGLMTQIIKNKR